MRLIALIAAATAAAAVAATASADDWNSLLPPDPSEPWYITAQRPDANATLGVQEVTGIPGTKALKFFSCTLAIDEKPTTWLRGAPWLFGIPIVTTYKIGISARVFCDQPMMSIQLFVVMMKGLPEEEAAGILPRPHALVAARRTGGANANVTSIYNCFFDRLYRSHRWVGVAMAVLYSTTGQTQTAYIRSNVAHTVGCMSGDGT